LVPHAAATTRVARLEEDFAVALALPDVIRDVDGAIACVVMVDEYVCASTTG
jgi:hypothetical protein